MGFIEGRHPVDVSGPLSGDQQLLQVLRITHWLMTYLIAHSDTPLTPFQAGGDTGRMRSWRPHKATTRGLEVTPEGRRW